MTIAKRDTCPQKYAWLIRFGGFAVALLICSFFIIGLGHNPFAVYNDILTSVFGTRIGFNETVRITIPLLGAAIAVGLAFKMKFWNIGAEGQILAGGIAATYFALFHSHLSPIFLLPLMALSAIIAGGIWGLIPAIFRAKWNTNETLFTLMLNYVAFGILLYLQGGPWTSPENDFPIISMFAMSARLPRVFGINAGWIIMLVVAVLAYIYMRYTKQGFQLSVVGHSEDTARYAGMNIKKIIMRTMAISGGIAGLVGFISVSGSNFTLNEGTAGGVGFTAIIVAWLARLNPLIMIPVAFGIAMLERGAFRIQTSFGIPSTIATVFVGIVLFCMLACEFFIQYRIRRAK